MKTKIAVLLALGVSVSIPTSPALARPRDVKCSPAIQAANARTQMIKFFEAAPIGDSSLSEEQKSQIATILNRYQPEVTAAVNGLVTTAATLSVAVNSDTFDEQAVRSAHRAAAAQSEELAVARAHIISETRAVLTPEQREKIDATKASIRDAFKQVRQNIQLRIQNWIKNHNVS